MKRLSLIGSWKRIGVQAGLLAGIGLAFVGGSEPPQVEAANPDCQEEGECTFKKPLFGIILDYSTSMNEIFEGNITRWQAAKSAITSMVEFDNGYIADNFILGLVRFGHDPNPNQANTPIANDTSGLSDGRKLDVGWYDQDGNDKAYIECTNGDAIIAALDEVAAPMNGNLVGIGTWTKGAMDFMANYIDQAKADHPEDMGERRVVLLVATDGNWTNPTGMMQLAPQSEDPKITAGNLWMGQTIPTYVVGIGDAQGLAFANELASAGGTDQAIIAGDPQALIDALTDVIEDIKKNVVSPVCTPGLPRIMVLMDASSSMLNINNGTQAAQPGEGGWDQARDALAGNNSIFDVLVNNNMNKVQNLVHLGLSVFGHNAPAEERILVQYGPCRKDNFDWALDPVNSCGNGCDDPYGGPPITWTFVNGAEVDPPNFDETTWSHMPKCDFNNQAPNACIGSGTYTHLGLNMIQDNIAAYQAVCQQQGAFYPCDENTEFRNILITDGAYNSTNAQVQNPLQAMYNDGYTTYVIGFGDALNVGQLTNMANWGSGNTLDHYNANNQAELEAALAAIIEQITFDPCCQFVDCDLVPEPTTDEPDPKPMNTTGDETGDETGDDTTGGVSATDATGDPTGNTTGDPTGDPTGVATETTDPTTGAPTTTDPTTGVPTTTDDPTNPTSASVTNPDPTAGETDDTDDTDPGTDTAGLDDEGCGCSANDANGKTRGLLGTLLTFGVFGFLRRRRRS